jgi:hypothetical protein
MRPDGELVSEGDLWSLMCVLSGGLVSRKRCRESVQSDSEFVQFGVGLRKIKDAGWWGGDVADASSFSDYFFFLAGFIAAFFVAMSAPPPFDFKNGDV